MESVRYAARLDTGEGFIAFAGGYLVTPATCPTCGSDGPMLAYHARLGRWVSETEDTVMPCRDRWHNRLQVGEIELPEGMAFGDGQAVWPFPKVRRVLPDGYAVWPFPKVRRMVPTEDDHFYLVDAFDPESVKMVTDLGDGTFLIGTDAPVANALWGGKVTEFVFDRAAYIEVAMA